MTASRQEQVEAFYDRDAATYRERRWFRDAVAQSNYRMTHAALFEALAPAPGERILEFGCGSGTWTREVAAVGTDVTAVDISEEMLQLAQEYTHGLHIAFVKADFTAFRSQERYDKAYGVRVFEHFTDKLQVLRTLYALLRPGGRLVIVTKTTPSIWNGRVRLLRTARRLLGQAPRRAAPAGDFWMERAAPWRMKALLGAAGFVQVHLAPAIMRLPVMARGEDEYPIIFPPLEGPLLRFSERCAAAIRSGPAVLRLAGIFFSESYLATGIRAEERRSRGAGERSPCHLVTR